jgi:hypothetical protein
VKEQNRRQAPWSASDPSRCTVLDGCPTLGQDEDPGTPGLRPRQPHQATQYHDATDHRHADEETQGHLGVRHRPLHAGLRRPGEALPPLAQAAYTHYIDQYLSIKFKKYLVLRGHAVKGGRRRGVQVAVPPLSGRAPHTIEAPGARRMAPAPHPPVSLSLRLVWVSVQALQPPRALGLWGASVQVLGWCGCRRSP